MKVISKRDRFSMLFWKYAQVQDDFWHGPFQLLVQRLGECFTEPTSAAAFFLSAYEANSKQAAKQLVGDATVFGPLKSAETSQGKMKQVLQVLENGGAKSTLSLCLKGLAEQRLAGKQLD